MKTKRDNNVTDVSFKDLTSFTCIYKNLNNGRYFKKTFASLNFHTAYDYFMQNIGRYDFIVLTDILTNLPHND